MFWGKVQSEFVLVKKSNSSPEIKKQSLSEIKIRLQRICPNWISSFTEMKFILWRMSYIDGGKFRCVYEIFLDAFFFQNYRRLLAIEQSPGHAVLYSYGELSPWTFTISAGNTEGGSAAFLVPVWWRTYDGTDDASVNGGVHDHSGTWVNARVCVSAHMLRVIETCRKNAKQNKRKRNETNVKKKKRKKETKLIETKRNKTKH